MATRGSERDPLGELATCRVPRRLLRRADAARRRELPHQRPEGAAAARHRHGARQAGARGPTRRSGASTRRRRAIVEAADEILGGQLRDQFVVDVYQAGAGTSHNMNTNEVLANRAAEILGEPRGTYTRVHPNDHVNMGQSTNDVFPTATRLAILLRPAAICWPSATRRSPTRSTARRASSRAC